MKKAIRAKLRTFEFVQYVSGPLEGDIDDWPPIIQDKIAEALERLADREQVKVMLTLARYDVDHDSTDPQKVHFVHCIASEIAVLVVPPDDVGPGFDPMRLN